MRQPRSRLLGPILGLAVLGAALVVPATAAAATTCDEAHWPAATQGVPLALAWANAREVSGRTPITTQDVELEQADCGHNVEAINLDMTAMEAWIDTILANPSSTTTLARAARGRPVTAPPLH